MMFMKSAFVKNLANSKSEDFKKKNLLINFWASWGDSISNHQSNTELKEIYLNVDAI
jgi:hypothetical protein